MKNPSKSKYLQPIKIAIKVKTEQSIDPVLPFQGPDLWVGMGCFRKTDELKNYRRFLRIRDNLMVCHYFIWNGPEKGKKVNAVIGFTKRVPVSWEKIKRHFDGNENTTELGRLHLRNATD